jgi:CRP/FNR family cyclic AMP-dependent transcriptional regulator
MFRLPASLQPVTYELNKEEKMISPELLRRYPFFSGLSHDQIVALAQVAQETIVDTGHYFFHEGEELTCLCLVVEGAVATVIEVPDQQVKQQVSDQLTGELKTSDVVVSAVGPGEVFGWSSLVPPHQATTSAKATTPCRLVTFNGKDLLKLFENDCRFGYLMMQKMAQLVRERLRDMRIESLAHLVNV